MRNFDMIVLAESSPLVTRGGSNERKNIIGAPTFNESKCGGNPDTSKEFKNSLGNSATWHSSGTVYKYLYWMHSPGNCSTKVVLMVRVDLLRGVKMQCSDNYPCGVCKV